MCFVLQAGLMALKLKLKDFTSKCFVILREKKKKKKKTEMRMTAGIVKQDPNTWKVQKNAIY